MKPINEIPKLKYFYETQSHVTKPRGWHVKPSRCWISRHEDP